MIPVDLASLKEIFSDEKTHIAVGKIVKLEMATDRSVLRAQCSILTQDRDVVAAVCWDACGVNSGSFCFPVVGDHVLIEFAEGDAEQAYVTKRLTTNVEKIPTQAVGGHTVNRSLPGKSTYLLSDTKILLGLGGDAPDPDEPLILGTTLITFLGNLVDKIVLALTDIKTGPIGLGNLGAPVPTAAALVSSLTTIISDLEAYKETYITTPTTNIVSQLVFTQRGV